MSEILGDDIAGNFYDKYSTKNPIERWLMARFRATMRELLDSQEFTSIHELGCGEGVVTAALHERYKVPSRGSDVSGEIIAEAKRRFSQDGVEFAVRSIYELDSLTDSADLIVCSEVLEHLDSPETALEKIRDLAPGAALFSVPREPVWRACNVLRGKYLRDWGNTPGHLQHWSSRTFLRMLGRYFRVEMVRRPFPWTFALCTVAGHRPGYE